MEVVLSTAYLAPIEYYAQIAAANDIFIESNEYYVKQSYRNRCNILSSNGVISLSIPIEHKGEKTLSKEIKIANHGNWKHIHRNAIVSAYSSTPYFEFYKDEFFDVFDKNFNFLFDLNESLHELMMGLLGIEEKKYKYTESYQPDYNETLKRDLRNKISPKIKSDFETEPYYQIFNEKYGFVNNLSIIDLLFNMGNESILILQKSK